MTESLEANELVVQLARLLHVLEIDEPTIQLCVRLLDQGVNPTELANAIKSINRETKAAMS